MTENQHNELITVTAEELMDRQFLPRHSVIDHFSAHRDLHSVRTAENRQIVSDAYALLVRVRRKALSWV